MNATRKFPLHGARLLAASILLLAGIGFWIARRNHATTESLGVPTRNSPKGVVVQVAPAASRTPTIIAEIAAQGGQDDLLAVLRNRLAAGASREEMRGLLQLVARERPAMAAELASVLGRNEAERYAFTSAVTDAWSRHDPDAAWAWVLKQEGRFDVPGESSLRALVLNDIAAIDPQKIGALVEEQMRSRRDQDGTTIRPAEFARDAVEAWLASGQFDLGRRTIEEWAKGDLLDAVGNAALERIALQLAERSPEEAAAWLQGLPVSTDRNQALATLAAARAATDVRNAMDWAASLGSDDGRADAMQRVFNRWGEVDVVSAAQWLADHEANPMADQLIVNLIEDASLPQTNPTLALRWVDLIADPQSRARAMSQVVFAWGTIDLTAAASYVAENTNFAIEEKSRLLQTLQMVHGKPSD